MSLYKILPNGFSQKIRLLTILFLGVFFVGCGSEKEISMMEDKEIVEKKDPSIKILAFGDSLTAGKGLEDPENEAYPSLLEKELRLKGYDVGVLNAGHSGDTTFDALERIDFSLMDSPHLVIVALGSNDTFQGKALSDIEENLAEIIQQFQESGVKVILCSLKTFPNLGDFYAGKYEKIFSRLSQKYGTYLTPFLLENVAGIPEMNLADTIHPSPAGHVRIVKNILSTVEAAVQDFKNGKEIQN